MCTMSESEAEISLSTSSMSTSVPKTRKRRAISYSDMFEKIMYSEDEKDVTEFEFGDGDGVDDSDEDFVSTKTKKKKVSGGKSDKPSKKFTKSKNSLTNLIIDSGCADSCTSPSSSNAPMVILKSDARDLKIDLDPDNAENLDIINEEETNVITTKLSGDINDKIAIERPLVIATPDQLNSRSFDKEQEEDFMTPSTTHREEINYDKMDPNKQHIVEKSLQFVPPVNSLLSNLSSEKQLQVASSFSIKQDVTGSQKFELPTSGQHQDKISTRLFAPRGKKVVHMRPTLSMRPPGIGRQATPGVRHPMRPGMLMLRPGTSMVNREPPKSIMSARRPAGPARNSVELNRPRVPGPRLPGCGSNLPNARPAYPYRQRSQSTPQYSSQFSPPVVELDISPPRPDQVYAPSPPSSVVSKLTSLGVSVARQNVPPTKHGWFLPPGISVTKTNSNPATDFTLALPSLAQALIQLGEVDGRKKIVQFHLTEAQIRALDVLGIKEERAHSAKC